MTLIQRFWSNVVKTKTCWLWNGPLRSKFGYGAFGIANHVYSAHRIAYELEIGEIKGGLQVLHRCDNGRCVRPDHLFVGTQKDNIYDMLNKGRFIPPHGDKCGSSKLTWSMVRAIRYRWPNESIAALARCFHVSAPTIHEIVHRKSWKYDPEEGRSYGETASHSEKEDKSTFIKKHR